MVLGLVSGCGGDAVLEKIDSAPVLSVGQTAIVAPATILRFDSVLSDSRCPTGVQCFAAGDVVLAFTLTKGSNAQAFQLDTSKSVTVQGMNFKLLSVTPYPASGTSIPVSQYRASVQVGPDFGYLQFDA